MASENTSKCQDRNGNAISVHELLLSVGQLKFSLKALMAMQVQNAGVASEITKAYESKVSAEDSNRILESVLNEVVSSHVRVNKCGDDGTKELTGKATPAALTSVEELKKINELLNDELQKIREMYYNALSIS